jgi:5-methyltetrahydropteroyltriglutamate--homocysteine methyltransferase
VDIINLEYEEPGHAPDILSYCGDKFVAPGFISLGTEEVASAVYLAGRIREALQVVPAERLMPTTDCGMWFLPRQVSFDKLSALAEAVRIVRSEIVAA